VGVRRGSRRIKRALNLTLCRQLGRIKRRRRDKRFYQVTILRIEEMEMK
jgi:hypothetical protein